MSIAGLLKVTSQAELEGYGVRLSCNLNAKFTELEWRGPTAGSGMGTFFCCS